MRRLKAHQGASNSTGTTDGPFASFTDLLAGIVFVLLIMVAILMLRQQKAVDEIREKADPTKYEATIDDMKRIAVNLIKENAELSGKLGETDGKLKALQADFRSNPRLHQAMVINEYSGLIYPQREEFGFTRTKVIYLTEDITGYVEVELAHGKGQPMFPEKPATSFDYGSPKKPSSLKSSCSVFDRTQWSWDCTNTSRGRLTRSGNSYIGQQTETRDGKTGTWDVRIDIVAIYDEYFR